MAVLQQEGTFKVMPVSWKIMEAKSGSVAVSFEFRVLSELENGEWASWEQFEPHSVYGDFWIIKKDGSINQSAVDQLSASLGWDGNLNAVLGDPPKRIVQVQVNADTYNGKTRYKAGWMNPEHYVGGAGGASESEVGSLQARFGGLLRAAASAGAVQPAAAPAATGPKGSGPAQVGAGAPADDDLANGDDIPF